MAWLELAKSECSGKKEKYGCSWSKLVYINKNVQIPKDCQNCIFTLERLFYQLLKSLDLYFVSFWLDRINAYIDLFIFCTRDWNFFYPVDVYILVYNYLDTTLLTRRLLYLSAYYFYNHSWVAKRIVFCSTDLSGWTHSLVRSLTCRIMKRFSSFFTLPQFGWW